MKNASYIFLVLSFLLTVSACKSSKQVVSVIEQQEMSVVQGSKEIEITKEYQTLVLKREAFSLRFFNKRYNSQKELFYAAQLAAVPSSDHLLDVETGMRMNDIPFFSPGTGMAANRAGVYESLIISDGGHHYLYFETEDNKRVNLLKKNGSNHYLQFDIEALFINRKDVPLAETEVKTLYLILVIDKNLNGTIEEGELTKLRIQLN